jgi:iron complex outermembrane receptor protein
MLKIKKFNPCYKLVLVVANFMALFCFSGISYAQMATKSSLEEVIVTAQRREQSLMEVPIAVSVVTSETMEKFNIEDSHDLSIVNPGLLFTNVSGTSQVSLRGVGTGYSGPGLSNSVALYTDESYITAQIGGTQYFFDMESVQVLKGPQGTLYGRNATGGALLFSTRDPDLDSVSGYVQAGVGEFQTNELEAAVNFPLGETLAVRFSGKIDDRDEGYVTHVLTKEKYGAHKDEAFRAKVLWQPTDRFRAIFKYEENKSERKDAEFRVQEASGLMCRFCEGFGESALDANGLGHYETNQTTNEVHQQDVLDYYGVQMIAGDTLNGRVKAEITALNLDFDLTDNLTLSSVSMQRDLQRFGGQDQDASPYNAIDAWGAKRFAGDKKGGITLEAFTQELKIASDYDGSFNYVAGWSHSKEDNQFVLGLGGIWYLPFGLLATSTNDNESNSYYVDGSYDISDTFTITAGVRTTKDELDISIVYPLIGEASRTSDSVKYSETTYRVALNYNISDSAMIYGSFNTGLKSGGFNSPGYSIAPPLDPEEIDAIEIGAKWSTESGTTFEMAFFDYEWENLQVAVIDTAGGGLKQESAAAAESNGFEFSANFAPTESLSLGLSGLYLDAEYSNYSASTFVPAYLTTPGARGFNSGVGEDLSGYQTANSPELTLSGYITYRFNIGEGVDAEASGMVSHSDEYDMIAAAGGAARLDRQDSLTMVNLNFTVTHRDGWAVDFYVNNALDEEWHFELQTQADGTYGSPGLPRMAGARIRYNF